MREHFDFNLARDAFGLRDVTVGDAHGSLGLANQPALEPTQVIEAGVGAFEALLEGKQLLVAVDRVDRVAAFDAALQEVERPRQGDAQQ